MTEEHREILLGAIQGYIQRNKQNSNSGGLAISWAKRLQEVIDQIEDYELGEKDNDLQHVIEEQIEWLSMSYSIRSHKPIETLNQIYYTLTGNYSDKFYASVIRNRR